MGVVTIPLVVFTAFGAGFAVGVMFTMRAANEWRDAATKWKEVADLKDDCIALKDKVIASKSATIDLHRRSIAFLEARP